MLLARSKFGSLIIQSWLSIQTCKREQKNNAFYLYTLSIATIENILSC